MNKSGLSAFQIELANLFFSLHESTGFLLAGGGALIAQGLRSCIQAGPGNDEGALPITIAVV